MPHSSEQLRHKGSAADAHSIGGAWNRVLDRPAGFSLFLSFSLSLSLARSIHLHLYILLIPFIDAVCAQGLRWKKYPVLAAGCILSVRSVIVQVSGPPLSLCMRLALIRSLSFSLSLSCSDSDSDSV